MGRNMLPFTLQTLPLTDGDDRGRIGMIFFVGVVSTHFLFFLDR
jgi:hypothetical protein